jgi:hypothetical protein
MSVTWVTRDTKAPVVQWWGTTPGAEGGGEGERASTSRRQAEEEKCQGEQQPRRSLKGAKKNANAAASFLPLDHVRKHPVQFFPPSLQHHKLTPPSLPPSSTRPLPPPPPTPAKTCAPLLPLLLASTTPAPSTLP